MKAPKNHGIQCRLWLATGLVALLLGGCASGPGSTPPSPLDAELASLTQLTGAEQALQLATQLRALNRAGQYSLAVALAAQVPIDPALGTPYIQVVRQVATALIGTNDYAGATDLIQTALEQAPTSDDDRAALLALKVQAQDGNRDPRGAMASLIEIISLTPPDATGRWLGDLWARAQLNSDLAILGDDTVSGWIALAQATQTGDPAAVRDWRAAWPDHPAMLVLPAEAEALLARGWSTPRRIGVILPLSGPLVQVGANLLDGIMSEQLKQRDITLIVADGQQGPAAAIAELTAQQVDLIVGPLPKGEVNQAITIARDIPLLTLNYSDVESTNTAPLAQMGLAPEDAAADAARIMLQAPEDTRRPIVLVPGDEIGTRVATAFQQQWSEQTGQAPIVAPYLNDDQRQVVANVTGIADSQARKQQLQRVLNTELEFTPRRRADLSAVYLYGDAVTAAQLKPLLAFYYAGDLPV
ncbi:MAG: penicillin-binding protein activator, partial [Litorivicinus sp.]